MTRQKPFTFFDGLALIVITMILSGRWPVSRAWIIPLPWIAETAWMIIGDLSVATGIKARYQEWLTKAYMRFKAREARRDFYRNVKK